MVDALEKEGIRAFGPRANAAIIESSKVFSKNLMKKYGIPTADYAVFSDPKEVVEYVEKRGKFPVVIKADGLALGKGVIIAQNFDEAKDAVHNAVSMQSILTTLRAYNPKRLICMFGAGGNRPKVRRFEMGEVSGNLADLSVITADNSRYENVLDILADIKVGLAKTDGKYIEIPDRREAIRWCIENAQPGDIIVLAGKGHAHASASSFCSGSSSSGFSSKKCCKPENRRVFLSFATISATTLRLPTKISSFFARVMPVYSKFR